MSASITVPLSSYHSSFYIKFKGEEESVEGTPILVVARMWKLASFGALSLSSPPPLPHSFLCLLNYQSHLHSHLLYYHFFPPHYLFIYPHSHPHPSSHHHFLNRLLLIQVMPTPKSTSATTPSVHGRPASSLPAHTRRMHSSVHAPTARGSECGEGVLVVGGFVCVCVCVCVCLRC